MLECNGNILTFYEFGAFQRQQSGPRIHTLEWGALAWSPSSDRDSDQSLNSPVLSSSP